MVAELGPRLPVRQAALPHTWEARREDVHVAASPGLLLSQHPCLEVVLLPGQMSPRVRCNSLWTGCANRTSGSFSGACFPSRSLAGDFVSQPVGSLLRPLCWWYLDFTGKLEFSDLILLGPVEGGTLGSGQRQLWCLEPQYRERRGGALSHGPAAAPWLAWVGTAWGGDGAEPNSRLTPESTKLPAESQERGETLGEAGG